MARQLKRIPSIPTWSDGTHTVQFFPIKNVPGFTHRVVIDGVARDWLGDTFKPSAKVASFFLDKHIGAQSSA